jgi:hypothetical protein
MTNSYIIWFRDGKYTTAWGETPELAKESYLRSWSQSIREVVSADKYVNALPLHLYLPCPVAQPGEEPTIHAPLKQPSKPESPSLHSDMADLKAQVAALTDALTAKKVANED